MSEIFFLETTGFSMHPFLKNGDRVIVKKVRAQDLRIGDIILYAGTSNNQNVCHRLVKKTESPHGMILFTRGDAGGFSSEPISEDNLIGQVTGVIRNGKVKNLNTKLQITINRFIAKFYVFFRPVDMRLRGFLRRLWVLLKANYHTAKPQKFPALPAGRRKGAKFIFIVYFAFLRVLALLRCQRGMFLIRANEKKD